MATRLEQSKRGPLELLFNFGTLGSLSDAELLQYFRADPVSASQEVFRILVELHGPMVLSVCRNLIKDPHEADDAFQATFLVLLQKVDSISVHGTVGPWLYGVACRVARRALRRSIQTRRHEVQSATRRTRTFSHSGSRMMLARPVAMVIFDDKQVHELDESTGTTYSNVAPPGDFRDGDRPSQVG
jgi:RNA polymerase sigma factor (sigma-70 family)